MAEEFRSPSLLKDVLRLVIQVDGFLDAEPFTIEKALELRQQLYDLLKRLEKVPLASHADGLWQVAARAFTDLQERLTQPGH